MMQVIKLMGAKTSYISVFGYKGCSGSWEEPFFLITEDNW